MWFATDNGVSRFDGTDFQNFNEPDGLCENAIFGFYEDWHGRIWFYGYSGQLCYYEAGQITSPSFNEELVQKAGGRVLLGLSVDRGDTIRAFSHTALFTISPAGEVKENYSESWRQSKEMVEDRQVIVELVEGKDPVVCVPATKDIYQDEFSGIALKTGEDWDIKETQKIQWKINKALHCILSRDGVFYLVVGQNLIRFGENTPASIHSPGLRFTQSLFEDSGGNIWVGTRKNGAVMFSPENLEAPRFSCLSGQAVSSICEDKEGGLWFTTLGDGVFYTRSEQIKSYSELPERDWISTLKISGDSNLFVGTNSGQVVWLKTGQSGTGAKRYEMVDRQVESLFTLNQQLLILSTNTGAILDLKTEKLKMVGRTFGRNCYAEGDKLYQLTRTNEGIFRNLLLSDKEVKTKLSDQVLEGYYRITRRTEEGNLYVATKSHLYFLDLTQLPGKITKVLKGVAASKITDIAPIGGDSAWVSTNGSGIYLITSTEVVNHIPSTVVTGNRCNFVLQGLQEDLWVGTNDGLIQILFNEDQSVRKTRKINHFHGLPSNVVTTGCFQDSLLYLGTAHGVCFFNPYSLRSNLFPPPIDLTAIRLNQRDTVFAEPPLLRPKQNLIEFFFRGRSFRNAGKVEYRYRLLGLDSNWNRTPNSSVIFSSLDDGDYQFEVAAMNSDGVWSAVPATVQFSILPPVYEKWWFWLLCTCLLSVVLYGIYRFRIGQVTETAALNEALAVAQNKALSAQLNPHFIFNSMNSATYYIAENDAATSLRYLGRFSKLMRAILENSKSTMISIRKELDALSEYMELEQIRFGEKLSWKIDIDSKIDMERTMLPALLLQPMVENAIWHGIMHKEESGQIEVIVRQENQALVCSIKDDGVGLKHSNLIKTNKKVSTGMDITKKRLKLLKSLHGKNSSIQVEEQFAGAQYPGAVVTITLPLILNKAL